MSDNVIELTCHSCGHTNLVNLADLEEYRFVVRGDDKPKNVNTYRVPCTQCGRYNVFDYAVEADDE